jgi:hypothetical protein
MNHAAEKESAAIASLIIFRSDSCRDAFFRRKQKKHTTDHLNILPLLSLNGLYECRARQALYSIAKSMMVSRRQPPPAPAGGGQGDEAYYLSIR